MRRTRPAAGPAQPPNALKSDIPVSASPPNSPAKSLQGRQLFLFFGLAYAISWIFFGALAMSRTGLGWLPVTLSLPVMTVAGTSGPFLAALLTLRLTERRWPRLGPWPPARGSASLAAAALLIAFTWAVVPAAWLTKGPLTDLHWSIFLSPSVFTISTLIGGPLLEEPGWRGFALPRLQTLYGPLPATVLLGVLWASWHLPLFLCPSWSSATYPQYLLIVTGFSFAMTFLYNFSSGSVLTAIAAHAFFNTTSRWLGGLLTDAGIRDWPSPVLVIGLSGWAVGLILLAVTRGRLGEQRTKIDTPVNSD